ncbi:ribosomal protein L10-domain-containing protein [Rhodofomes roseus]|uniref:Ribosomal protein L10-domain-containing protein n=1 Tax=Rhodofomes roseus TaxID=34475 RepID=A0ABQ8K016_9APHY|nr:ribosomal protein L10-domain-containing protein [Rhodofomes roseus]KAH9829941.1 ribosomal protein L10-domain-containing protein [Rhodofomes roseus]
MSIIMESSKTQSCERAPPCTIKYDLISATTISTISGKSCSSSSSTSSLPAVGTNVNCSVPSSCEHSFRRATSTPSSSSQSRKDQFTKLKNLLVKHPSIFVVNVDNVGSKQMHQIRVALRGKGIVVLGKNTMVRRALRSILAEFPQFERLLPHVKVSSSHQATSRRSMYYTANRKKHSPTTLDRFQARLVFSEHGA